MVELLWSELVTGLPEQAQLVRSTLRLLIAALCGAVIGLQRELRGKPAGLRTHILVASGTALFLIAADASGLGADQRARVVQGIATGIGFLGAGAILKLERGRQIKGLTTAAGIWLTAAAAVAAGLGQLGLALLAAALAWVVLALLARLELAMQPGMSPRRAGRH